MKNNIWKMHKIKNSVKRLYKVKGLVKILNQTAYLPGSA